MPPIERVRSLDGLRGIAIVLVLLNHFATGVEPYQRGFGRGWSAHGGGLVGVQVFFVLSGYLITTLLLSEFTHDARIRIGAFYLRRVRRLMPALLVVCAGYGIFALIAERDQLTEAGGSILRALTYTGNVPVPWETNEALTHTWSLAVEEQFYLAWPIVLLVLLRWRGRPVAIATAVLIVLGTIIGRELLPYILDLSDTTLYFVRYNGFRWDALMIGALLALRPTYVPKWVGWLGWAGMLTLVGFVPDDEFAGWVFTASTLACAAVVATAGEFVWLSNRVLVYLGWISYSVYLWHVVVMRLDLPWPVALVLTFAVSIATFHLVERPLNSRLFPGADRRVVYSVPEPD